MDENREDRITKSPGIAAFISIMLPGGGFFYIGNYIKGVTYMIVFATLIGLEVNAAEYSSGVMEIIVFALLLGGFYFFQIIESYNEARKTSSSYSYNEEGSNAGEEISLFGSIVILIMGILFLMANLDLIHYRDITRMWPLL